TYKTDLKKSNMKIGISFADNPEEFEFFNVEKEGKQQWLTDSFKLKEYKGKEIVAISLLFDSDEKTTHIDVNVGEIKVSNNGDNITTSPANAKVINTEFNGGVYSDVELAWEPSESDISHYEIYRSLPNGEKVFVGATTNDVYYISDLKREDKENNTDLEIVAVNKEYKRIEPYVVTYNWID